MEFLFTDNVEVDSIEKVPQDFRGLYKPAEGGKFKLGSDDPGVASAVSAVTRLNESLKAARAEAKGYKAKAVDLSSLSEFGDSPETIAQAVKSRIDELTQQVAGGKDAKVNIEKIKQELAQGHANDIKTRETRIEGLKGQLDKLMVENTAKSAIAELKGDMELLMPFVTRNVKTVEENGEYKVYVVDGSGDIRYSGVSGQPMSIVELVREMKGNDKYAKLFESEAPSGGGFRPGGAQRPMPQTNTGNLSATEKISQGLGKLGSRR